MARPGVDTNVILDAAAELVAERGFGGVRIDEVATRAGVAKGVLYLRFTGPTRRLSALAVFK
ncbi:helix-turn-helix domain-containing protein [Streptosporangium amethystogenes]|uniref:helix-turn-helix domain-containing protein n=1 Tax=Streptosporangium amethystogenes TaxID=2002 RepID=UPI0037A0FEE1